MIKNKKAFGIAFFYVGIGSIVLFNMFPGDPFYNEDFSPLLMLLTLPTNFTSFGILYSCADCQVAMIIVQLIFFFAWYKFLESRV